MWTYITNVLKNNKFFNDIFKNPNEVIELIKSKWSEPHRHYHGVKHLYKLFKNNQSDFMTVVSAFHDIVYDPSKNNNEEESIKVFNSLLKPNADKRLVKDIVDIINDTKTGEGKSIVSIDFQTYDRWYLNHIKTNKEIKEIEQDIYKEYRDFVDFKKYKEKRIEFLKSQINTFNKDIINKHIEYVNKMKG